MSLYDDVLGAPDRETRRNALDRYGLELLGGRMNFKEWWNTPKNYSVAKSACRASWNAGMAEQKEIDAQIAETLLVYGCKEIAKAIRK